MKRLLQWGAVLALAALMLVEPVERRATLARWSAWTTSTGCGALEAFNGAVQAWAGTDAATMEFPTGDSMGEIPVFPSPFVKGADSCDD